MLDQMLTKKQVAAKLGISVSSLDGAFKSKLPRYKIGASIRFRESEVEAYILECKVEVRTPLSIPQFKYVPGMRVCKY